MAAVSPLVTFEVRRYTVPTARLVGDRRATCEAVALASLTVIAEDGSQGVGFAASLHEPLPPPDKLEQVIQECWFNLMGRSAASLANSLRQPWSALPYGFGNAVDQAVWDLAAKQARLPLFRYLGGYTRRVPAYSSGLCFALSPGELEAFYSAAVATGHRAFKVKIGRADPAEDLDRLISVRQIVGEDAVIMADANEAWDATEAERRVRFFKAAGVELGWLEDPLPRDDAVGLAALRKTRVAPVNGGENCTPGGRLRLLAAGSVDVLNINDGIADGLRTAWAAGEYGIPVTLGNTVMNIGAHVAAAIGRDVMVEDSELGWEAILAEPLTCLNGAFQLSETPGHGLTVASDADERFGWRPQA